MDEEQEGAPQLSAAGPTGEESQDRSFGSEVEAEFQTFSFPS